MWHRRFLFMDSKLRFLISSEWNNQGAKQAQGDLNQLASSGSKLTTIATGAVVAGGAAAAAFATKFVADSVREFGSFEKGMREVFTLLPNLSGDAREKMTRDTRVLASEMGRLPDEVVPALYQAISAGVPQENVFEFLKTANEAARGGVTDLETAVDGLSSVVNAYGSDVLSVGEASDAMFTAVKLGKTNFEELSRYLFNVVPTASAVGLEFTNITAALAAMTAQGTPTSVATTQLRQLLVELNKEGSKVGLVFQEIAGVSFRDFLAAGGDLGDALQLLEDHALDSGTTMDNLFSSVEAGNAALALTGKGADTFNRNLEEMEQSAGATEQAFDEMSESGVQSIENLSAAWAGLQIATGEYIASLETLPQVVRGATDILNLASGVSGDRVASQIEAQSAAVGDLKKEVEGLLALTPAFESSVPAWLSPGGYAMEWLGYQLAVNEVTDEVEARISAINTKLAEEAESVEDYRAALQEMYGDAIQFTDDSAVISGDGFKVYLDELDKLFEDTRASAVDMAAGISQAFRDMEGEGQALEASLDLGGNVAARGLETQIRQAAFATTALSKALHGTAEDMDRLGATSTSVLGQMRTDMDALTAAQYEAAFRSGLQESERYVTELISAQEELAESQGEWVEVSRDTAGQVGRIHEQLAADLTDEQAKAYRELLTTAVEGSAEWRAAWNALQGDLTTTQRNELVAQVGDLQAAHGEMTSVYTGDAQAAEEAKTRIVAAQAEIREAYRQTAFEQLLAQADMSQLPAILEWAEQQGIIGEGEAELRLQFAETMAAIESRTAALADGQGVTDDYLESITLLTTGLLDSDEQAQELAGVMTGPMVQAFVEAAKEGGSLEEVLARIGFAIETMPKTVQVAFESDLSNWNPPTAGAILPEGFTPTDDGTNAHGADGGIVVGGIPGRDSVRAMLMPGEFVVRTDAAERIGYDTLNAINEGQALAGNGTDAPQFSFETVLQINAGSEGQIDIEAIKAAVREAQDESAQKIRALFARQGLTQP